MHLSADIAWEAKGNRLPVLLSVPIAICAGPTGSPCATEEASALTVEATVRMATTTLPDATTALDPAFARCSEKGREADDPGGGAPSIQSRRNRPLVELERSAPQCSLALGSGGMGVDFDQIKEGTKAMWSLGDYRVLATYLEPAARDLVEACGISPKHDVLDVAAGNGNCAIANRATHFVSHKDARSGFSRP